MAIDGNVRLGDANNSGTTSPNYVTLSASGLVSAVFAGALTLPAFAVTHGTLDGPLTLPVPAVSATLATGHTGRGALALPAADVHGTALTGGAAVGALTLPAPQLDATFGTAGAVRLPALTLTAAAVSGSAATATLRLPALQLAGTALQDGRASGALTIAPYTLAAAATASAAASAAIALPAAQLAATGAAGGTAAATLALPVPTVTAAVHQSAAGAAAVTLPAFASDGLLLQTLPAIAMRAVVVNTATGAATTYSGLPANSVTQFGAVLLAATDAGLVSLDGTTDDGAAIAAQLAGGLADFGSAQRKRVLGAYVGYRADGPLELTLTADAHHAHAYRLLPRQDGAVLHPTRVKTGRGVAGRYWQWRLANHAGAGFTLQQLTLDAAPTARKV